MPTRNINLLTSGRVVREMLSHADPAVSSGGGGSNNEHLIHQCSTSGSPVSMAICRKRQYQDISTPTIIEWERTSVPQRPGSAYARKQPIQPQVSLSAPATPSTGQLRPLAGLAGGRFKKKSCFLGSRVHVPKKNVDSNTVNRPRFDENNTKPNDKRRSRKSSFKLPDVRSGTNDALESETIGYTVRGSKQVTVV